jgi:hypothetical protein
MSETIYLNGMFVRERDGKYGPFFGVSINLSEFEAFAKQHGKNGELRLNISKKKQASKTGVTHSVSLDTYEPKSRQTTGLREGSQWHKTDEPPANQTTPPAPDDDVPF